MRASPLLATCALLGAVACVLIAPWTRITGNPVPVAAGIFLAVLLGCAVAYGTMFSHVETTPSERSRWADGNHLFSTMTRVNMALSVLQILFAGVQIVRSSAWTLLPLMAVACAALALAWGHWRRERAGRREAAAESAFTGPKIIGLRRPEEVPRGWVPLVVHRPHAGARDSLVDYRVHVDGDRVGTVGPGESLVVGLPPGPHSVQCRFQRFSSAPVSLVAVPGVPVDLMGGPGGTAAAAASDQRSRPEEYIRLAPAGDGGGHERPSGAAPGDAVPVDPRGPVPTPPGRAVVVVHRPGHHYQDSLRGYRVRLDGVEVGAVRPGGTLVIGTAPGAHRLEGRIDWCSSPSVAVAVEEGRPAHFVLEPNGTVLGTVAALAVSPGTYLRLTRAPAPWPGSRAG